MRKIYDYTFKEIVHKSCYRIQKILWTCYVFLLRQFVPINNRRLFFISWGGMNFSCSPKAIAMYLLQQHRKDFNIVVVVDHPKDYENYKDIIFVKTNTFLHAYYLTSSLVIIANTRQNIWYKRCRQKYIQTWHGTGPKKSEKDSLSTLNTDYVKKAKIDCEKCDLALSGSTFLTNWYYNSTWYQGPVLECGTPRDDLFFRKDDRVKEKVCNNYGILGEQKIVLYAPTFRNHSDFNLYKLDFSLLLDTFNECYGGNWIFLIRMHPNLSDIDIFSILGVDNSCRIINVTNYPDMQDLLYISDILITDFSSTSTEFAISKKPCFLYAPDIKEYDRGLYFSLDQIPFPFSETQEQLIENIKLFNEFDYKNKIEEYNSFLGMKEKGNACEQVYEYLKSLDACSN